MCFKPHGILKSNINKIKVQWVVLASHCPVVVMKFEFCARSARLLRKHDHTVKLDFKELLNKEQIDFKELFTDYQLFYTINLLLNKKLLPI